MSECIADQDLFAYSPHQAFNVGGGIKNALSSLGNKNFIVTNSDILWKEKNNQDVLNFIHNYQEIETCKLLLAADYDFVGFLVQKAFLNPP